METNNMDTWEKARNLRIKKKVWELGIAKLYPEPHPKYETKRNSCHCKRCLTKFAYYERIDFNSYSEIPDICPSCAPNEEWWNADNKD